jgi:hypothetical protein
MLPAKTWLCYVQLLNKNAMWTRSPTNIFVRYRVYFKQGYHAPLDSAFWDSMMASDLFLGFELVEEK